MPAKLKIEKTFKNSFLFLFISFFLVRVSEENVNRTNNLPRRKSLKLKMEYENGEGIMDDPVKLISCSSCGAEFKPDKIIEGLAKCPYCGYLNSMD